uniref:Uncharacterized protein n=1 Tax=Zea mays TaxID=4577 RepID=A0A804P249_MAIZE
MVRPRKSWSGLSPAAGGPNLTRAAEMNRSVPRLPACFYNSGNLRILSDSNVQDTSLVGTRRPFTPIHPTARASPTTSTFSSLNNGSSPSFSELLHRKEMDSSNPIVDEAEDLELPRPIGQQAAYDATDKVAKKGAKKAAYDATDKVRRLDELDRFEKIQNGCHANRMKVLEMQHKISNDKIEASKLSLQAAKDEKEARLLEKESKMLETYACLLKQDMSAMHDEIV